MDARDLNSVMRNIPKAKKKAVDLKDFMKPMDSIKSQKSRPAKPSSNHKMLSAPKMPKAPGMPTLKRRSV